MMNDEGSCLDDNMADIFGTSPSNADPFSTSFPLNETNHHNEMNKSSSILSLTDYKPGLNSLSRTSSATSFSLIQTPSILHNGESSPLESFQQMDEFQKQLNEDFLRNSGIASLNLSPESTFKPRMEQFPLFKFNKQIDFLNSIPKSSSVVAESGTVDDIFESFQEQQAMSTDESTSSTPTTDTKSGIPQGYKIINGEMYNDRGYKICGFMNQHNRPCQRIGKCPFHDRMKQDKPLSTTSDGIISAQDSIEPEQYTSTQTLKDKKKQEKKSQKKTDSTLKESTIQQVSINKGEVVPQVVAPIAIEDKPATKKPYKQGWTKDEHIRFLKGLEQHGKGSWKEISLIVGTRTPTQIQSHAQKYFLRQKQEKKNKRSIHDFTMDDMKKASSDSVSMMDDSEITESTHKRKRNKAKKEVKKVEEKVQAEPIVKEESSSSTFDETMFKNEIFGETFIGGVDSSSLMKQFSLSPPKQGSNYMELINKLHNLKSLSLQQPNIAEPEPVSFKPMISSGFECFPSSDELDFHLSGKSEPLANVSEPSNNNTDLYDAWEIGSGFFDLESFNQPFLKKQKL